MTNTDTHTKKDFGKPKYTEGFSKYIASALRTAVIFSLDISNGCFKQGPLIIYQSLLCCTRRKAGSNPSAKSLNKVKQNKNGSAS